MTNHEWISKFTVLYGHAHDAKKKAIDEREVEIRQCMEDIIFKLDMLTKTWAERVMKGE